MDEWQRAIEAWLGAKGRSSVHTARAYGRAMEDFLSFVDGDAAVLGDVGGADVVAAAMDGRREVDAAMGLAAERAVGSDRGLFVFCGASGAECVEWGV